MLVVENLKSQLEITFEQAMRDSLIKAFKEISSSNDSSYVSPERVADIFAKEFKKCAGDIANSIDSYIKSAQITMNLGTTLVPAPGLSCSAGPVSGTFTLASPTVLLNSIS